MLCRLHQENGDYQVVTCPAGSDIFMKSGSDQVPSSHIFFGNIVEILDRK